MRPHSFIDRLDRYSEKLINATCHELRRIAIYYLTRCAQALIALRDRLNRS